MSEKPEHSVRVYGSWGKKRAEASRVSLTLDFDRTYDEVCKLLGCKEAVVVEEQAGFIYYQAADGE